MEKDILIQNLRTRIGEDDCSVISDKTFAGVAESVLPQFADDDKITDETYALPVALLKQFAGQKRFDEKTFTEKFKADYAKEYETQHQTDVEERIRKAKEAAVEEYKKKHPDKEPDGDGGSAGDEDIDKKVNDAVAAALKGLTGEGSELSKSLATITSFVKKQTEREKTETMNRVKAELKKHLLELKANNEACIEDALNDIDYGDEPTFDGLKQSAISAYEKRYKRYYANGGEPFGGNSTGNAAGSKELYKKHLERVKTQVEDAKSYAESISFAK